MEKSSQEIAALANACPACAWHKRSTQQLSRQVGARWTRLGCYALRGLASSAVSTRRISTMRSLARRSSAVRREARSALLGSRTRALARKSISPDMGALVRSVDSSSTLAPLLARSWEISRTMPGRSSPTNSRSSVRPVVAAPASPLGSPTTLRPRESSSARRDPQGVSVRGYSREIPKHAGAVQDRSQDR